MQTQDTQASTIETPKNDLRTPGQKLEDRRKELGIKTIADLGRRAGNLSRQYMTAIKRDRFTPKLGRAKQIADALEMDVLDLFPTLREKVEQEARQAKEPPSQAPATNET